MLIGQIVGVFHRAIVSLNKTPTVLRSAKSALRVACGRLRKRAQQLAEAPGEGCRRGETGASPHMKLGVPIIFGVPL